MKRIIKIIFFISINIFFSCKHETSVNIIGKWKIESIREVGESKNNDLGLAYIALLGSDYKENTMSFSDDNSFLSLNKNGEVFQKGTFELLDNNLIMSFDNEVIEEYEIVKNNGLIELKSDKVILTITPKENKK